jgi:hypothetical protein
MKTCSIGSLILQHRVDCLGDSFAPLPDEAICSSTLAQ